MKIILSETQINRLRGILSEASKDFLPFDKAKDYVRSLNLKTSSEWRKYTTSGEKPNNIPSNPQLTYKDKGWINYGDWIGTNNLNSQGRAKLFLSFEDARKYAQSLEISSFNEWRKYSESGEKPNNLPRNPDSFYKNSGWISWGDFLGTGRLNQQEMRKRYLPFDQAKDYVQSLNISGYREWKKFCLSGKKPNTIPPTPSLIYKDSGWTSWGDWLGTDSLSNAEIAKQFLPFNEARKYVRLLKITSRFEWQKYCLSGEKPNTIPSNPDKIYKDSGWISLGDFLGNNNLNSQGRAKLFLPFEEARSFMRKLNFLTWKEFRDYAKTERPLQIPSSPWKAYKYSGWTGMYDWLVGSPYVTDKDFEREYLPLRKEHRWTSFEVAKDATKQLGFNTQEQWQNYIKTNRPKGLPYKADEVYSAEWQGWDNFLGVN